MHHGPLAFISIMLFGFFLEEKKTLNKIIFIIFLDSIVYFISEYFRNNLLQKLENIYLDFSFKILYQNFFENLICFFGIL